jgi:uncharacterized protein YndB with AHSA1/START domain
MTEPAYLTAQFARSGPAVRAEWALTLDNHLEEVWSALTDPSQLPKWLAPGKIELREGGAARLAFADSGGDIESRVTAVEPMRLLEYSWSLPGEPLRPLRWELEPIGPMTRLTLQLSVPAEEDAARAAAGWAAHLEMLQTALIGVPTRFPFEVFQAAREAYREQVHQLQEDQRTPQAVQ